MKKIKVYFVCTHLPNCNFQIKICNFSYGPKAIYLHDHSILVSFSLNQETRSWLVLIKMALFWIFLTHYWTVWFRYTLFSICTFPNLHGFRSAQISICTDFDLQSRTFSSLHGFRSAQFSLCNFWICKDFALLSIRSARILICSDSDLHIFRYANKF